MPRILEYEAAEGKIIKLRVLDAADDQGRLGEGMRRHKVECARLGIAKLTYMQALTLSLSWVSPCPKNGGATDVDFIVRIGKDGGDLLSELTTALVIAKGEQGAMLENADGEDEREAVQSRIDRISAKILNLADIRAAQNEVMDDFLAWDDPTASTSPPALNISEATPGNSPTQEVRLRAGS